MFGPLLSLKLETFPSFFQDLRAFAPGSPWATLSRFDPTSMRGKFEALAREHSDFGSAKKGGDLGLFKRGRCGVPGLGYVGLLLPPVHGSCLISMGFGIEICKGGVNGRFWFARMQKAFEEASFALKVNELSDIVSTDSGEHLILRIQ